MRLRYIVVCERDENSYADGIPIEQVLHTEKQVLANALSRHSYLCNEKFQIIVEEIK